MSAAVVSTSGPEEPPELLFSGERHTRSRWRLGLLILLSLLGHAASFYVLQVAYTPTGSLLPPPARVMLVPLDRPENAPLAHWLALADPTLATQPPVSVIGTAPDSLGFRYVPSYDSTPPAFKPLDTVALTEGIAPVPRPVPPGPVAMNAAPIEKPGVPADGRSVAIPESTRVIFSGGIGTLAPVPLPPVHLAGGLGVKPLEPTIFLVGVRAEGGTPFLFPVRQAPATSTSANADEADDFVRNYLAQMRFQSSHRADGGMTWGRATFYWGNDLRRKEK